MKYEITKGSEKDFEGAHDFFDVAVKMPNGDIKYCHKLCLVLPPMEIIAERRPITDESDLNECIAPAVDRVSGFYAQELSERCLDTMIATKLAEESDVDDFAIFGKYDRQCKGVVIDVYDVLQAFEVVNPALQHLIKKALCASLRGHKKREQDLVEILESAKRAIELEGK